MCRRTTLSQGKEFIAVLIFVCFVFYGLRYVVSFAPENDREKKVSGIKR